MKLKIFSIIAIMAFAFSLFFSASPPVAAETGKSFNQASDNCGFSVNVETAQTVHADVTDIDAGDNGDIPIVSDFQVNANVEPKIQGQPTNLTEIGALNSREKFSRTLSRNFNEKNLILKDDRFIHSPSAKFTDAANKGFSGIGISEFARAKV